MSFSESIDLNVTARTAAAADDLRDVGEAAKEAQEEVDKLDQSDIEIAIDDAQLPAVKEALEEIRDEADKLDQQEISIDTDTTGLDRLDTAARTASTGVDKVRDAGDKTKGVMSNLTGNAVQDLGSLVGVGGSAGVALGQLAERASEGGVALRGMATAVGGIAAVGVVLEYLNGLLDVTAKSDAFNDAKVKQYKDAILEGVGAAEALRDALVEAQGVQFIDVLGGGIAALPGGADSQIKDITSDVVALGLNVKTFSELASGSTQSIDAWKESLLESGADAAQVRVVYFALHQEHARLDQAAKAAAVTEKFIADQIEGDTPKLTAHAAAVGSAADAYARLSAAQKLAVAGNAGVLSGTGVQINNYHPPQVTPQAVKLADQEYRRIQEGPGGP